MFEEFTKKAAKNSYSNSEDVSKAFAELKSRREGLSSREAKRRLKTYGPNSLKAPQKMRGARLLLSQFSSPLILLLVGAAILSYFLGGRADALIIFSIVLLSGLLGFFQERGAINSLEKLLQLVESKVMVLRDGKEVEISLKNVVPGDVIVLNAGDLIPADCILFEAKHLFIDEAMLTGESMPSEKNPTENNNLYLGTMVASGMGKALALKTGKNTEYSSIAQSIRFRPPETAFEAGVRKLGYFMLEVTLLLVIAIFALNTYLQKPVVESFLFSLALAVGLTPQLLPAIISVNLSHGARRMAKKEVIVKHLPSIENFGQMDILCTDKTGTITEGKVELQLACNLSGKASEKTALYAFLNAHFQAGYTNPLDLAILQKTHLDTSKWHKTDEIPYDFIRKRLSVVLSYEGKEILITKGAVAQVLTVCNRMELPDGTIVPIDSKQLQHYFEEESQKGFRVLGVAYGNCCEETNLIFMGFLTFLDPIKADIAQTIEELKKRGVALKILTGDHPFVAMHVATTLGVPHAALITGPELRNVSDRALLKVVREKNIFAQLEPNQKERIILALRKLGHVVGYLGDGINDVSALHSADVGIAVDSGADAAKEAADIVLLKKDLNVLQMGIEEGRATFANTMKYIYMATSANFGNMFSMAGVSLFLNFLPLLPKQILLTNFLSDFPEIALATDNVDGDVVRRPIKWNIQYIRRFMLIFGPISSIADFMTFGILLYWMRADQTLFRTGWFVESVVSAALIILVIRTRKGFWRSNPSKLLALAIVAVVAFVAVLPYTSLGQNLFDLSPLPMTYYAFLAGIIAFYVASVEIGKRFFFRHLKASH